MPPILTAVFLAALASALMSTADSSLLAGASVVTQNVFPLLGRRLDPRAQVLWTRIMVGVSALVAVVIAMTAATIYELGVVAWSLLLVGLFSPFALGMYWKRANQSGAVAATIGGFVMWGLMILVAYNIGIGGDSTLAICEGDTECAFWDATYIASLPAFLTSLTLVIVVSLLTGKRDPAKPITDIDGNTFDTSPLHNLGITPLRDALRKLRPDEIGR
jgi:Na+/proline symporter